MPPPANGRFRLLPLLYLGLSASARHLDNLPTSLQNISESSTPSHCPFHDRKVKYGTGSREVTFHCNSSFIAIALHFNYIKYVGFHNTNVVLSPVHTSNNVEATFDFVDKNGNNVERVLR